MISGIAQNVVNVTDTAFLGQLSSVALGAAGNSGIFYFVLVITAMGFTTGSQIIIGRRNGEENYSQIGKVFQHSFYFVLPLALVLFVLMQAGTSIFLQSITKSKAILEASISFLNYRSYGVFFALINFVFIAFYVGTTNTTVLIVSTFIMMFTNVFLDYGLIFGNFGLPQLGIKGAAIASSISEMIASIFFIFYTYFIVDWKKYDLFKINKFELSVLKRILKIGSPIMIQNFLSLSSWFIFFIIIEKMGEVELAVSHIVRSIYMVLMIPLFGLSNATNTMVSNLIGQNKIDQVFPFLLRVVVLSIGCTFVVLILNIFIPEYIIGFYTKDILLIPQALSTLKIINITMFLFCVAFIFFNGVTGTGNTKTSLLIEFITIIIYLIGAYYIAIVFKAKLEYVWCSEFIYFILLGGLSILYMKYGNWKQIEV